MKTAEFNARDLQRVLRQRTVCTFEQLADALGTQSRMTVFRKLTELPYLTSCSHRGKYYALRSSCQFDAPLRRRTIESLGDRPLCTSKQASVRSRVAMRDE